MRQASSNDRGRHAWGPNQALGDTVKAAQDAARTLTGIAVMGMQRAQVGRAIQGLGKVAQDIDLRAQPVIDLVDHRLDELESVLPGQARALLRTARSRAHEARARLHPTEAPSAPEPPAEAAPRAQRAPRAASSRSAAPAKPSPRTGGTRGGA